MAYTVLYRKSSNEVVKISNKGQPFADRNKTYWGVLTDPIFVDGTDCRDENWKLRVLGYAKIAEPENNRVRNATQEEIDSFADYQTNDEKAQDRDAAKDFLSIHPRFRKLMIAFADVMRNEINALRSERGLAERTLSQVKNAILNRISEND